nr:MAG TPA: hypothetical protein [Caudoviricetes sp.]
MTPMYYMHRMYSLNGFHMLHREQLHNHSSF